VIFGPLESPQCELQFDDHDKMIYFFHIENHLGDQMIFNWKVCYKLENSTIFEGYRIKL
jgi:hypothetical protein